MILLAVVALAAALRFPTLGLQSFWLDETYTASAVLHPSLGTALSAVADTERTPPLYYCLAWAWTELFPLTEAGLRSLSAVVGTATVPVAYAIGREVASRRAGLAAAALVATNPFLVNYSQEARAHALAVFLGAVALLFHLRYRRHERPRDAVGWGVASALLLATFYYGAFLVAAQAAWLLLRSRNRRPVVFALAGIALVGIALAPLALHQGSRNGGAGASLPSLVALLPVQFLLGPYLDRTLVVAAALIGAGAAVAVGLMIRRSGETDRRAAFELVGMAAVIVVIPLVIVLAGGEAVTGTGTFKARNVIVALVPLLVAASLALTSRRAGRAGQAALAAICIGSIVAVVIATQEPDLQRPDWKGVASMVPATHPTLLVRDHGGNRAVGYYLGGRARDPERGDRVDTVVVVRRRPVAARPAPLAGFEPVSTVLQGNFWTFQLRAPEPRRVDLEALKRLPDWPEDPSVLFVRPR